MSKITLAGRVGTKDELRTVSTANGERKCLSFSVADMKAPKDADPWYRVTIWDAFAEKMSPYINKGVSVMIEGNLNVRTFTKKDGTTGISKEVQRVEITLMGSRSESAVTSAPSATPAPAPAPAEDDGFMNIPDGIDEELPFN